MGERRLIPQRPEEQTLNAYRIICSYCRIAAHKLVDLRHRLDPDNPFDSQICLISQRSGKIVSADLVCGDK